MRYSALALLPWFFGSMASYSAPVDGSQTEVAAETRLRDYLRESIYPPENRLLDSSDPALENVPGIPGDAAKTLTILGFSGEKVLRGSLYIRFRIRAHIAGTYSFRTYLADAQGRPRVQSLLTRELGAGEAELEFIFYGKALRDVVGGGPFHFTGIVGEKLPGSAGAQGKLPFFTKNYTTEKYNTADFTGKEWDSPEKREKIRNLKKEIAAERLLLKSTVR